jgi:hypothetical protein
MKLKKNNMKKKTNYFAGAMGPENKSNWEEILKSKRGKSKKFLKKLILKLIDAYYYKVSELTKKIGGEEKKGI